MSIFFAAFLSAVIFGVGLGLGGMTNPDNVLAFLDIAGDWRPNLALVMISAIAVHAIGYRVVRGRARPMLDKQFHVPTRRDITWQLIAGSALFGVGWGMTGLCPGPTIVAAVTGNSNVLWQAGGMVAGMMGYKQFEARKKKKHGSP